MMPREPAALRRTAVCRCLRCALDVQRLRWAFRRVVLGSYELPEIEALEAAERAMLDMTWTPASLSIRSGPYPW